MPLASFISSHLDLILVDWVTFAKKQLPAAGRMDQVALLDHGKKILEEVVVNMARNETERETRLKSEGKSQDASTSISVPSRIHGRQRERQGFEIGQMVGEYRALRATVLRLWQSSEERPDTSDLNGVIRFNEAIDQALAESVEVFSVEVERARDVFLGMLGHDLRGPLSTIASCASLELAKWPADARQAPLMLRSVAQMKALLDDLMEFTKYRLGGGLSLSPSHLVLDQFVQNTLDEIGTISIGRILTLEAAGDMEGEWDPRRLHQALSNLVFNALKYGFPSSPIKILLDGTVKDSVCLTVQNTGKPIPSELLPKLWDPLIRESTDFGSDSEVAGANLGLGLHVVREIALAHGGSVQVTSTDTVTQFQLSLPRICSGSPSDVVSS
ncbi:ATP-binding protein [Variovorax sp. RB3P1]|uniref:ATP-binding protein n=1 Tax=Variovorax sp. RB3P1 TaxID=3443732 RepID=UPI003F47B9FB